MTEKQKPLDGFVPDCERYREASEPHPSVEAAEEAVKAFFDEVGALRVKYHMKDLLLVWGVAVIDPDGVEMASMGLSGFGNQALWESMAAFAYGVEKTNRAKRIGELLREGD